MVIATYYTRLENYYKDLSFNDSNTFFLLNVHTTDCKPNYKSVWNHIKAVILEI